MKKKQKIIIAVSVVFVVVIGIIVSIVINNKNNTSENIEDVTSNTCSSGYEIIEVTEADTEAVTEINTQNSTHVTQMTAVDESETDVSEEVTHEKIQNYKNYDLSKAKIIAEKNASFGKIKLYSAVSNKYRVNLIEATSNNKKYYYEMLGSSEIKDIILKNVDGENGDEIIILAKKSNGTFDNLVIKITKSGMVSLLSESEIHEITSIYSSELKENFNVEVYYGGIDKMTINVRNINKEDYTGSYWDASGKLIEELTEDPIWFDNTFSLLEAKDVDGDGVCEIICSQEASMGNADSFVGYAKTTIKYSTEHNKFIVTNTSFIPAK